MISNLFKMSKGEALIFVTNKVKTRIRDFNKIDNYVHTETIKKFICIN